MDSTTSDPDVTQKIHGLPELNEREYAQYKYDEALKAMLKDPTPDNIQAFVLANDLIYEVQDAYRIGSKLLLLRSQNLHAL